MSNNATLSKEADIVLRLLDYGYESDKIDPKLFTSEVKSELISCKLIFLHDKKYYINTYGNEVVTNNAFIVKYPLGHKIQSYKDTLLTMTPKATRALGLSLINTQAHKKMGKAVNTQLYLMLKESMNYYKSFDHPISIINAYNDDMRQLELERTTYLISQFNSIDRDVLVNHLNIKLVSKHITQLNNNNTYSNVVYTLHTYLPGNQGLVEHNKELITVDLTLFTLDIDAMESIIRQYYKDKSNLQQHVKNNMSKNNNNNGYVDETLFDY